MRSGEKGEEGGGREEEGDGGEMMVLVMVGRWRWRCEWNGMDGAWMGDGGGRGRDEAGFGLRWDVICELEVVW